MLSLNQIDEYVEELGPNHAEQALYRDLIFNQPGYQEYVRLCALAISPSQPANQTLAVSALKIANLYLKSPELAATCSSMWHSMRRFATISPERCPELFTQAVWKVLRYLNPSSISALRLVSKKLCWLASPHAVMRIKFGHEDKLILMPFGSTLEDLRGRLSGDTSTVFAKYGPSGPPFPNTGGSIARASKPCTLFLSSRVEVAQEPYKP